MKPLDEQLLERLREVGLSRYEAAVYLGLVTDQNAKVTEISKRTGVPQPKVYQALDSLVEKGFCSMGSDLVNRYRPIDPNLAFQRRLEMLARQREETVVLSKELEQLLEEGAGRDLWAPPVEIVKGLGQVVSYLTDRIGGAQGSIEYFGKLPQVPAPELSGAIEERSRAGVEVRLVVEKGYLESTDVGSSENESFREAAAEVRVVETLPSKMVLIDRASALLSISRPDAETFLMIVFRHQGLVDHFVASFERTWDNAEPS